MTMADRVVIMRGGEIQQIADPDTLFNQPDNLFVAGFIGSPGMNFLSTKLEQSDNGPVVNLFGEKVSVAHHNLNGSTDLIAGIRPEHISLGEGPVSFKVRPSLIESLGSEKYVYFDGGAHKVNVGAETDEDNSKGLIARIGHSGSLDEGEEVSLSFDLNNLYLFDRNTERAL